MVDEVSVRQRRISKGRVAPKGTQVFRALIMGIAVRDGGMTILILLQNADAEIGAENPKGA